MKTIIARIDAVKGIEGSDYVWIKAGTREFGVSYAQFGCVPQVDDVVEIVPSQLARYWSKADAEREGIRVPADQHAGEGGEDA